MICEDLQLYILDFIPDKSDILSNFQLVCWKDILHDRLNKVYWNKVEELIGKNLTDKMKQGSNFNGEFTLDLSKKNGEDCRHLAKDLAEMKRLNKLSLCYVFDIGDNSLCYLFKGLVKMKGLKWLVLWHNRISDESCRYLAKILPEMKELDQLWLYYNKKGDDGCRHLAQGMIEMKGLKYFSFGWNHTSNDGKEIIREAWDTIETRITR